MPQTALATRLFTTLLRKDTVSLIFPSLPVKGHGSHPFLIGDAALALLQAGADKDLRDMEGHLALDLAPDTEVRSVEPRTCPRSRH